MARLQVRSFEANHVGAAAALLGARQERDCTVLPMLHLALAETANCEPIVAGLSGSPFRDGVVAMRDGELAGFLFGQRMMLPSYDFASQFIPAHSISIPVEGHAVAAGEDSGEVYRAMYGELAARWVGEGFFVHRAAIVAADPAVQEAWVALGFGRYMTAAVRTTDPVIVARAAQIEIHQASGEDLDEVMRLADDLAAYHSKSPMFWPVLQVTHAAAREFNREMLDRGDPPAFLAYRDGKAVALQSFLRPGFIPPIVEPEANVYLYEGVVDQSVRAGGIGATFLAHTLAAARGRGDRWCTLHFASGNPTGGPFWLSHGFVPVEYTMERRVDERVAWAKG